MRAVKVKKSSGRPIDADREKTRRNILEAAKYCFGEYGYRSTSSRAIAEKAGVAVSTIYFYFADKSELYLAVYREIQDELIGARRQWLDEASTIESLTNKTLEAFAFIPGDSHKMRFLAIARIDAARNPEIAEILEDKPWLDVLEKVAQIGLESGELIPERKEEFCLTMSAVYFALSEQAIELSPDDYLKCVSGFMHLYLGTLINVKGTASLKN